MAGGLVVGAIGFALLCRVDATTPFIYMAPLLALIPAGTGITVPAMTASILASVERNRAGTASAVLNTARQVGGAIGVALFGGLVAAQDIVTGLDDTVSADGAANIGACGCVKGAIDVAGEVTCIKA